MNLISPKRTARRKVVLSFALFAMVTLGVFGRIFLLMKELTFSEAIKVWFGEVTEKGTLFVWLAALLLWLFFRFRYIREFKQ